MPVRLTSERFSNAGRSERGAATTWPVQFMISAVNKPPGVPSAKNNRTDLPTLMLCPLLPAGECGHGPPELSLVAGAALSSSGPSHRRAGTLPLVTDDANDDYLAREAKARKNIDRQLVAAGWIVQNADEANVSAGRGVAVREFVLEKGHGRVDYLLFLDGQPAGVIEAKPEGTTLVEVEHQSGKYVDGLPDWIKPPVYPLPFIYESTGTETRFTNGYDPDARSRRVFTFHRPETLAEWARQITANPEAPTFRARLRTHARARQPASSGASRRPPSATSRSRSATIARGALIQMATGSGKTFTAANICYRLIKHADAKRILFLVDRSNLGKQTKLEFDKFVIADTQRNFPAEYIVQHLTSNTIDTTARVCISTVQRIYSILKGEPEMDPELDEHSIYELPVTEPVARRVQPAAPARGVRHRDHRRVPPLHLRAVAPGARVLRRAPHRPHRDADQADLRLLPAEPGDGVFARDGGDRQGQRRLHRLQDRDRHHQAGRRHGRGGLGGVSQPAHPQGALGSRGRARVVQRHAARSRRRCRGPDPHGDHDVQGQAVHRDSSRAARRSPRP